MGILDRCTPVRCGIHSTFVSKENECSHIGYNNGSYVRQYQVDGQVIPASSPEERCDFLLLNDTKQKAYYIELKGSDIPKAMSQIDHSVEMLQGEHPQYTIYRRIVFRSGSHEVNSSAVVRWKKRYGVRFVKIERSKIEEAI